jgi:hypothetical protein
MIAPVALTAALRSLPVAGSELREIDGVADAAYWALTVPGADGLRAWRHFREQVNTTGFWPVIVGQVLALEIDGSDEALEALLENAREERDTGPTPAEVLELARADPFEEWVRRQRDPRFQESEHLRQASFFGGVGAEALANLHRETAERWRHSPPWTFDPADYLVPPRVNRSPPQHALHCVRCYDPDQRQDVIAKTVTILLVPTRFSWEVPAFLLLTTKTGERPPQVHVAALHWLAERFGADLVGVESRILEVLPGTRPLTAKDALHAAAMICAYSDCSVTSENELTSIAELAVYLMESEYWTFCWP